MNKKILLFIFSAILCLVPFLVRKNVMAADDYTFYEKTYNFEVNYTHLDTEYKFLFSFKTSLVPVIAFYGADTPIVVLIDSDYSIKRYSSSICTPVNVLGYNYSYVLLRKNSSGQFVDAVHGTFAGDVPFRYSDTLSSSTIAIFNDLWSTLNGQDILNLSVLPSYGPTSYYYQGNYYDKEPALYSSDSVYFPRLGYLTLNAAGSNDLGLSFGWSSAFNGASDSVAYIDMSNYSLELWASYDSSPLTDTAGDTKFLYIDSVPYSAFGIPAYSSVEYGFNGSYGSKFTRSYIFDLFGISLNAYDPDAIAGFAPQIYFYFRYRYDDGTVTATSSYVSTYININALDNQTEALTRSTYGRIKYYDYQLDDSASAGESDSAIRQAWKTTDNGGSSSFSGGGSFNPANQYNITFDDFDVATFLQGQSFRNLISAFQQIFIFIPSFVWELMLFGISALLIIALLKSLL